MSRSILVLFSLISAVAYVRGVCLNTFENCGNGECCPTTDAGVLIEGTSFVYPPEVPQCCLTGPSFGFPQCGPTQAVSDIGGMAMCKGTTNGDPQLRGFDGRTFLFLGKPYTAWNMISERDHQLNAWLIPASMFDHNGTYISAFGLQFKRHQVLISVADDGHLQVFVDGKPLVPTNDSPTASALLTDSDGQKLSLQLDRFRPVYGNVLEFSTNFLNGKIWAVAPGAIDEGGMVQPAYLDSQFTILSAPANGRVAGVLGETAVIGGSASPSGSNDSQLEAKYKVQSLFDNTFADNLFSAPSGISRALLETDDLTPHDGWVSVFPSDSSPTGFANAAGQPTTLKLVPAS